MAYKDVILKYLSHISPKEIAEFVGVNAEIVESLSEEIKDIRIADLHADFVLRANEKILHVEFQQEMKRDDLNRFYVYNALLTREFDRPINTYIIYLGSSKIPEQKIIGEMVRFEPALIRISEMDAKAVLEKAKSGNGNIIAMALMPLMKNCQENDVVNLIDAEATMKISEGLKTDILTSTLLMSSTVYGKEFVKELRRRLIEMYDVDIFEEDRQKLLEQFEKERQKFEKEKQELLEKGKTEGKIEGKIEMLRESVSILLFSKFKDSYTIQMKNAVNKAEENALNYITAHIFDISLDDVKKILFIS
ncbi:MAG: hypothetical protein M1521_02995 [Thermotogae bacterium]|jgi:hypothetical protein|nr:hypothetical protein [Thermotogota bacterium]